MKNASLSALRQALLTRLRRQTDTTTVDFITVLAGHGLRLALGLVSSALLARGLGPADFSAFSVVGAVMMIAVTLGDLGLSQSAVRYVAGEALAQPAEAIRLSRAFSLLKLLGTLSVVAAGILLAQPLSDRLGLPPENGALYLRLGAIGALATAVSGIVATLLQSLRRFTLLVGAQTLNIVLTVLLMAALFLSGRMTVVNALLIGVVTALAAALVGTLGAPSGWRRALIPARRWPAAQARRLWTFGRWLWFSTILSILLAQLDLLLVSRLTSPVEAGYYALALNLSLKADMLNQTVYTVLLPQVSALAGRAQMGAYAGRSLVRGAGLALLLLPVALLAGPFIGLVYGHSFVPATPLFLGLLLTVAFDLLVQPLLLLAYPLDMPRAIAGSQVIRVTTLLAAASLLIPVWGGSGAVAAKLSAKLLGALILGGLILARIRQDETPHQPDEPALP